MVAESEDDLQLMMNMFFGGDPQIVIAISSPKLPSRITLRVKLINFQVQPYIP